MEYDMNQILRLAQSPAGKQLMALLQKNSSGQLQQAAWDASRGNFEGARRQLGTLLDSPQVQSLLKQMEEQT